MSRKTALIAGVGGMCGSHMANLLKATGGWDVIGISRSPLEGLDHVRHISADLLDLEDTKAKLKDIGEVTHIFYTALLNGKDFDEENELNARLMRNFLDVAIPQTPKLEHVHVLEGVKQYGYHQGEYRTPAREDDPACVPPYFYEMQHAHVLKWQSQPGQNWTWSCTRPGAVMGFGNGARINLMTILAVYATVLKELGEPLHFPGDEKTWNAASFMTDVRILNRAMLWSSTDPRAANQAYNIGNGDAFRWKYIWKHIADQFGMEAGGVKPTCLVDLMKDKSQLWDDMIARNNLRKTDLQKLVLWNYADTVFSRGWDNMISMVKANKHGFHDMIDTYDMVAEHIANFRSEKIIP